MKTSRSPSTWIVSSPPGSSRRVRGQPLSHLKLVRGQLEELVSMRLEVDGTVLRYFTVYAEIMSYRAHLTDMHEMSAPGHAVIKYDTGYARHLMNSFHPHRHVQ